MNRRRSVRIALLLAALLVFFLARRQRERDAGPAGLVVPAHAASVQLGQVRFQACELAQRASAATTSAYCARFPVPERWEAPQGKKIELAVALVPSDAQVAEADLLLFLAGGPGQAAIETYPSVAAALAPAMEHRHLLLVDQRGTGGSNALTCPDPDPQATEAFDPSRLLEQTRACLERVRGHADPAAYTTTQTVEDLEALRLALGGPQLDLLGVSYGTRVAQQYLMRHPGGVRSVVLDSVVPNQVVLGQDFAANLDRALKAQLGACTAEPDCWRAFTDPWQSLLELRARLRARPEEVRYRDPLSYLERTMRLDEMTLAVLVRMFAYAPETSALLPLSIAQANAGSYGPLVAQIKLLRGDLEALSDNAMQLSVICAEDADLLVPRPEDEDSILGERLAAGLRAQCDVWPRGTRPDDFHQPLHSDAPLLILEGQLDPVTPPAYGEMVLAGASRGRMLVARGNGHSVLGRGCFPKLVASFLEHLDPAALDTDCLEDFGPLPALLDFNGAGP